ncbi:uncharacterized protein LOC113312321 [Papaver somniferum]|uniref:uncharacterized protein LOC113312321 n=1 Tax=Papaver somniferum TaxID=3469 RepID=UPI000E6F954D|nr:uncharacterized protein LOC113312321 [Papaver somniferum]
MGFSTSQGVASAEKEGNRTQKFIERINKIHTLVEAQLQKSQAKYKAKHDKHRVPCNFSTRDLVWLRIGKERLKGEGKKLKPIRYGPFKILKQFGDNAFQLDLPPCMQIYFVINAEYLKLLEPPLLNEEEDDQELKLPPVEDLWMDREEILKQDCIVETKITPTRRGNRVMFRVGRKGQVPSKAKWFNKEQGETEFPHIQFKAYRSSIFLKMGSHDT